MILRFSVDPRWIGFVCILLTLCCFSAHAEGPDSASRRPSQLPAQAERFSELCSTVCDAYRDAETVWLVPLQGAIDAGELQIPRVCAPLRSFSWLGPDSGDLKFVPEPDHWRFTWKQAINKGMVIKVVFDVEPRLLHQRQPAQPSADGSVMLHAYQATTHGEKLRYEPQWYKNTVGYWTVPDDYATWELEIEQPGRYTVAILQGCGREQGGSEAVMTLHDRDDKIAELRFQTIETGHFQNFRWHHLGEIDLSVAGTLELKVAAKRIANKALFDVRAIHLVKQATE